MCVCFLSVFVSLWAHWLDCLYLYIKYYIRVMRMLYNTAICLCIRCFAIALVRMCTECALPSIFIRSFFKCISSWFVFCWNRARERARWRWFKQLESSHFDESKSVLQIYIHTSNHIYQHVYESVRLLLLWNKARVNNEQCVIANEWERNVPNGNGNENEMTHHRMHCECVCVCLSV